MESKIESKQISKELRRYSENLFLVNLDLPQLEGFRDFISCWIYKSDEITFVVDPGPSSTIPVLLKALETLEIKHLDFILLSQIHLDHGGGSGYLLQHYPQAQINCHPKGIPHLIDPLKLWEGSLKVLGKIAQAYGAPLAVPEQNIFYSKQIEFNGKQIQVTETPGHASHHICYQFEQLLFAAEAAGVSITAGDGYFMRPATPPRFIYEVYKKSLQITANLKAEYICLGHHGMRCDPQVFFGAADRQLEFWMKTIREHFKQGAAYTDKAVFEELLETDPALALFEKLDKDIQQREAYFCLNSIHGMIGYVKQIPV